MFFYDSKHNIVRFWTAGGNKISNLNMSTWALGYCYGHSEHTCEMKHLLSPILRANGRYLKGYSSDLAQRVDKAGLLTRDTL